MLDDVLIPLVETKQRERVPGEVIKNMVKEYLQYPVLEYVYNSEELQQLVFYGGSCVRICYDGPRLSEDLDFTVLSPAYAIDLDTLAHGLERRFRSEFLIDADVKVRQSEVMKRVTLKFPILKKLGLAPTLPSASDLLHVKIEISLSSLPVYEFGGVETSPVAQHGFNVFVRHYTLPILMAGKINALLSRVWFKGKREEVDIKGRDFFDLYWFFDRKVEPAWETLKQVTGIATMEELKSALWEKIEASVTPEKLVYDLKGFFANQRYVRDFAKHYKEIMKKHLT
ncbi:hypothetical protein A3J43_01825 [Candidatus Uhrbacteria bacterium RIFCSPHIGHO2_12_FULL_54_23]|uniref:Nucleotidyl transferase AbiEii/AbiGii toxin family protein n=2 Tax=Candidatus Uhriibacteriota TaxID=1752732 RepID=A0A1F7UIR6_9BACT|nr:MAG: hypothetical protein A3J43_01825 [Candidatus Uhrbacteria bacterium RIFCSPHIGHO2_12_FULL_54_23]OGL90335.1 MAG: hypothetical protein A3J36_01665 [Candidatus Uhrbacteria bacterium RIFCSPLOWO2_02_FULL_54_37]